MTLTGAAPHAAGAPGPGAAEVPGDIVVRLRRALGGGARVDDSARVRAEYSTDASNYRVLPAAVVVARDVDDVLAAAEVCRATGTPLTLRGGGTSVAGNAVGPGVVVDTSRHLTRVLAVDPDARTATVEPGVVLTSLQAAARPHGLRFGPDPSTQARCTLGGMIGNNACGPHAVAYGRTADNVVALDWLDGRGRRFTAGAGDLSPVPGLEELVGAHLGLVRTELGRFPRQVSGYSLEHLLPENGRDLAKALVGTEGTCGVLLGATVRLVDLAPATALAVLAYPDMAAAADAVPALLPHHPLAVEGIDARLVDVVRHHKGEASVPDLPPGGGWLLCEVGGGDEAGAFAAARRLAADAGTDAVRVVPPGPEATALWRIREDGAGLAGRTPAGAQAWPGWEDAAVPPERLGDYLRGFAALLRDHGVDGLAYGHFGDGCVHVRIDLPLADAPQRLRPFLHDAADLVVAHGGSLSGEHGDGRARSELLARMYSPEALRLFEGFKALLDPDDVHNPGVLVRPRPVDADLRRPLARPAAPAGGFALRHDSGDLTRAVHRCVGVGKCRADTGAAGGFMCPSYLATREEKDSTRGRARVLQELTVGTLVGGVEHPAVAESLDLCLSCKACASDCPAGVDMATYKAEWLHRRYRGRLRPPAHYALGWLPRWSALVAAVPGLATVLNTVLRLAPLRRLVLRLGGMDPRRGVPRFAPRTLRARWAADRTARPWRHDRAPGGPVLLWADSFTDGFGPDVGEAARRVLEAAGHEVVLAGPGACCGLTWISTGQLDGARERLRRTLDVLAPHVDAGLPVVGLEPSCTVALMSDLPELVPDDPRAPRVAAAVRTLAQQLQTRVADGWTPPDLSGLDVVAQPHCHQHSETGYGADLDLLQRAGARVRALAGCCGLAGNWGMEAGHHEVSVAVAERALLPALREAAPGTVLLADGFSCRTQAADLAGVRGRHLAELLADRLPPD
ncbi:FAD-binding and (Fe-S)-binding domain-containing protein [Aquipuribacter nitratireducens]|uniref:FAD-binding and (Fe-S)-binding domain-containing protein n=1 Tax=Aquipuribacter nitratireducens TaxID=650104 RepID=A0ABW0GMT5_9MICO